MQRMESEAWVDMDAIPLARPLSKALYDYWNALRNGRPMPYRREVDPARLRAFLPRLVLLEQVSPGHVVFRLAGTTVCAAFGRELRDHTLHSLWRSSDRFALNRAASGVLREAGAAAVGFDAIALERRPLLGEMTLLPLLDDRGLASRLMGSFDMEPLPAKLAAKPFVRLELISVARIAPERDRVVLAAETGTPMRPLLALAEQSGRSASQPSLARPWSRLVQGLWEEDP